MGILDKLKPQPRWKNADPAIRLEALRELDDPIELALLAESDPDARVRRLALGRVSDVAVLSRIAANDADTEHRDRAADRLLAIAGARGDAGTEAAALEAVRALADPRRLATLAKGEASEGVREESLARIGDPRSLGSIARHAKHVSTAHTALARITESSELVDTALHAENKDVASAAFDRVVSHSQDLSLLRSIETRTQHKTVGRRARTMIQDIETAEAKRVAAIEDRRRREQQLCEAVERIAEIADVPAAEHELSRVTENWRALGVSDPAAVERFARGSAAADEAIVRRRREAEEAADRRRLRAEAIATRDALCARVETLDGDDVLEQLVPIEEEWRSLLPLVGNGQETERLAERFAVAVAACRKRHAMRAEAEAVRGRLETAVTTGEALAAAEAGDETMNQWQSVLREAREHIAFLQEASVPADDLAARVSVVAAVFDARLAERDAAARKARQEISVQLHRLCDRAKRAAEADAITLREGERLMRDIVAGLEAAEHAGSSKEIDEAAGRLRAFQETIAPRVRELREMEDWRRFANAQRQEQLIAMAEAIVASLKADDDAGKTSDLAATARALRELHAKWQEVAEAPRHTAQRLWDRFRTATDFIRSRCEAHFAKLREERQTNLRRKAELVAEAESLASSTDWARAAARFQELQGLWQASGTIPHDAGRELSQRFRAASNTFFARRREDLASRKKTWNDNLARKEALCLRAEELAVSTEWDAASAELKRLQAEWKTIGPVRRNKSDAVWNRFRAACDQFFEAYHHRHETALAGKLAEREAIVIALEALLGEAATDDIAARVQELRTTWNRSVPVPVPGMKLLNDRWQAAISQLVATRPEAFAGTDLDPTVVLQRMEKLVHRLEASLAELGDVAPQGLSQTQQLAERLRSALASNAMGGRVNEDVKRRAAGDALKDAQVAWQRLPPISLPEARALESRFRELSRKIGDRLRPQGSSAPVADRRRPFAVA